MEKALDPNPGYALRCADTLGEPPTLPVSLADVNRRAELIQAVDRPFAGELPEEFADPEIVLGNINESAARFADDSAAFMPDVPDVTERVNITLRLWAGCIWTAKTIRGGTKSGENTPQKRAEAFESIDERARDDHIFRAGVEAAPSFLGLRGQRHEVSFDGVPEDSPVRRHG